MINLVKIFILKLFSTLPDSPFASYFGSSSSAVYYEFLNWFLPVDICTQMLGTWLFCMLLYYVWESTIKKLIDLIVEKLLPLIVRFFITRGL